MVIIAINKSLTLHSLVILLEFNFYAKYIKKIKPIVVSILVSLEFFASASKPVANVYSSSPTSRSSNSSNFLIWYN